MKTFKFEVVFSSGRINQFTRLARTENEARARLLKQFPTIIEIFPMGEV